MLATDILVFALFAASLQFLMGDRRHGVVRPRRVLRARRVRGGARRQARRGRWKPRSCVAPVAALAGALVFGWFCVRLSGVYLAMLTLAFAQIAWSIAFQWDSVTGGSNGVSASGRRRGSPAGKRTTGSRSVVCGVALAAIAWIAHAPFGYALRAGRDSPLRAEAIGIDVRRTQWMAFAAAGAFAGLAGGLFAFSKGSISPETLAIPRSVDALVMVLLGGLNALAGPLLGAAAFTWLSDTLARVTEYWRAVLGAAILVDRARVPDGHRRRACSDACRRRGAIRPMNAAGTA